MYLRVRVCVCVCVRVCVLTVCVRVCVTGVRLREGRVAVGGLRVGRAGVGGEGARAARALHLVGGGERRVRAHAEPLEREERARHLPTFKKINQ